MTGTDRRDDPYSTFNFRVVVDDVSIGEFSEVSGLTVEGDAIDYLKAAKSQTTVRKLVGLHKYANITLKRGYMRDQSLWHWYRKGQSDRRNIIIELINAARQPLQRWHFDNAWVNKIEGPSLKASGNEITVETLEIAHEGLNTESIKK
jgi:phage tail-like protein